MPNEGKSRIYKILFFSIAIAVVMKTFVLEGFIVRGNSMHPTIQSGDYILVNKLAYAFKEPAEGDIIVAKTRGDDTKVVKRIVGMPGKKIEVGADFHINIDPYEYFVMGDNRDASIDSVEFGAIDAWDIKGKVFGALRVPSLKYLGF